MWRIIFFVAAGFYFVGNTIFVFFGKGTIQPWNYQNDEDHKLNSDEENDKEPAKKAIAPKDIKEP